MMRVLAFFLFGAFGVSGQTITTLASFCETTCNHEIPPIPSALVQAANGDLWGTTEFGGTGSGGCPGVGGCGTIFKVTPGGALTTMYNFCIENCLDGSNPMGPLVLGLDGNLFGTTSNEGPVSYGTGTIFKITSGGAFTTIYGFCPLMSMSCAGGSFPAPSLVQALNGDFYGSSSAGVFKITPKVFLPLFTAANTRYLDLFNLSTEICTG